MSKLNFKVKILLLALVPLIILGLLTTALGLYQTSQLGQKNLTSFSATIYDLRREELSNYTQIARTLVGAFVDDGSPEVAKEVLRNIRYGDDGYIFVYDFQGQNLVHPIKPELEGTNLWEVTDDNGVKLVQELVANAQIGGGYTEYQWHKPSKGRNVDKISYSSIVPQWGWMLGTGLYVDDLDDAIDMVESEVNSHVTSAGLLMAILALGVTGIFTFIGFRFTAHESSLADAKLKSMALKASVSQSTERSRIARELQKSVNSHLLVAKKKARELTAGQLEGLDQNQMNFVAEEVSEAIKQIYHIIGQLRPPELDQGGLDVALKSLTEKYTQETNCEVTYKSNNKSVDLRWEAEIAIYRAVTLALDNVERHAGVNKAQVIFHVSSSIVRVMVKDEGVGFDVKEAMKDDGRLGSSVNEIETLIISLGGKLNIFSTPNTGSVVRFDVPLS